MTSRPKRLYASRKRILVTGGAGFLGLHLIDRFRVRAWLGLSGADAFSTRQACNPTVLSRWTALRENRALVHDHIRPGLLDVW